MTLNEIRFEWFFHLTEYQNLTSILTHGLLPSNPLTKLLSDGKDPNSFICLRPIGTTEISEFRDSRKPKHIELAIHRSDLQQSKLDLDRTITNYGLHKVLREDDPSLTEIDAFWETVRRQAVIVYKLPLLSTSLRVLTNDKSRLHPEDWMPLSKASDEDIKLI